MKNTVSAVPTVKASARMRYNTDPRDHYYIVRCVLCQVIGEYDRKPLAAARDARKHARDQRRRGVHETYVIDVNALRVTSRHRYERLALALEPPY